MITIIYKLFLLYPYWLFKIIFRGISHFFKTIFSFHINEKKLDTLTGLQFEILISKILKKSGYHHVALTKNSNDYGIDILAEKNHLTYGFQCKRYQKKIGVDAISQTKAGQSYYQLDCVAVITNSYFTNQAVTLAQCNDILLIDRNQLLKMIKKTKSDLHCIPLYDYIIVLIILWSSYHLLQFIQSFYLIVIIAISIFLLFFMILKTLYYGRFQKKENYPIHYYNDKI